MLSKTHPMVVPQVVQLQVQGSYTSVRSFCDAAFAMPIGGAVLVIFRFPKDDKEGAEAMC